MRKEREILSRIFIIGGLCAVSFFALTGFVGKVLAAGEFKIGFFNEMTGPAALFGPTARGAASLAADQVNSSGGILGKQVKIIFADGGKPPAEAAKSAMGLMLNEKVDFFMGSHNSAVREALVATIKGKTPYVYTPVYEGGECSPNVYVLADTPRQQIGIAIPWLIKKFNVKNWYFIGNDYVWPHTLNKQAQEYIATEGGKVIGEEYVPWGAPNIYEEVVTRIKGLKPDAVFITLVGSDNVNFNRAFGGFGLDKDILRMQGLLEENTLIGIGAENSKNMYACSSYNANIKSEANEKFKADFSRKFSGKPPQLSVLGEDSYCGVKFIQALVKKAGSTQANKLLAASEGLTYETPGGPCTMYGRHAEKNMYLTVCKGVEFEVLQKFEKVRSETACK